MLSLEDSPQKVHQTNQTRSRTILGVDLVMVRIKVLVEEQHSSQILNISLDNQAGIHNSNLLKLTAME